MSIALVVVHSPATTQFALAIKNYRLTTRRAADFTLFDSDGRITRCCHRQRLQIF